MKDGRSGVERFLVGEDDQNRIEYVYLPSISSEGHDGTGEQVREKERTGNFKSLAIVHVFLTHIFPITTALAEG